MKDPKHEHHRLEHPNGGKAQHDHRYYWQRAHRDWRVWFCTILMLAAMLLFAMRRDLSWRIHGQPRQPVSATVGK